ncbi:exodeoxyribonuclease III [Nitrosophilus kaiyonis]|uniref:exodeoxyribonuclease III n=1 Tax=Nitrosophilus kaiyonis TaxID=2930200 RepID=UPI00248FC86F|nr:exodeoxyribonuclease III [Nitrosophilus kaiyonis]
MTIATFNVNSIRARKDLIIRWLTEKVDIDVLCFQEIKCEEKNFPFKDFNDIGYECEVYGQKAYNGVAICSKLGFENIQKGFNNEKFDQEKRFIRAKISGIDIMNVYAPHGDIEGPKHTYKLEFYKFLKDYIKNSFDLENDLFCVVGDMNIAREDIDVWEPEILRGTIGFMDDEREAFEDFLSIGLIDLYRKFHPESHGFTWWDYMSGAVWRDEGMRIDYILSSKQLSAKCESIDVDMWTRRRRKPTPSDHAPVVAKFNL